MKTIANYPANKYLTTEIQQITDNLVVEESLLIYINGDPFTMTMRTPGFEQELTIGLLFTEKILDQFTPYEFIIVEKRNGVTTAVNVLIEKKYLKTEYLDKRNLLSVSSCGICGKLEKEQIRDCNQPIISNLKLSNAQLLTFFDEMKKKQSIFSQTSGCHAAAIFNQEGKCLSIMEDIGRHNAVDKVIGDLLIREIENKDLILLVSGRISYEIVTKAFVAGIPILAAISASSSLAVDLAEEMGITLVGFCREDRATCYTHNDRITN